MQAGINTVPVLGCHVSVCPAAAQAYGELAFNFIPRSYIIPEQYWLWRSYLLASASPPDRKWVLKANIHRSDKHYGVLYCSC